MATLISVSPKASTWAVSSEILEHDRIDQAGAVHYQPAPWLNAMPAPVGQPK